MIYYLHHLSEQFIGFHVFLYVTFRAIAAAVTAFLVTLIFGNFIIRKLTALKLGQPIRGAAEVHRLAELHGVKQGTPTMGGVLVIGAVFISSFIWARPDNRFVWLALFSMIYLGALGFVDDYLKVTKKKSDGISGRIKLVFQLALAAIVTSVFLSSPLLEVQARSLYVPFFKAPVVVNIVLYHHYVDPTGLGIAYVVLALALFLAYAYGPAFRGVLDPRAKSRWNQNKTGPP